MATISLYTLFVFVIADIYVHGLEPSRFIHASKPTSTHKLSSIHARKAFVMGFGMCFSFLNGLHISPAYANAFIAADDSGFRKQSMFIARKGAFEMDVELYIKNLAGGNKGKTNAGKKTPLPTPRIIDERFASSLLNIVDQSIIQLTGTTKGDIETSVNERLPSTIAYFREFAPLTKEKLSDQYYFDVVNVWLSLVDTWLIGLIIKIIIMQ